MDWRAPPDIPALLDALKDHETMVKVVAAHGLGTLEFQKNKTTHGDQSILIAADNFTQVSGTESAIGVQIDGILDEPDRAVGHRKVHAAGMEASKRPLSERIAGTARDRGVVEPVGWVVAIVEASVKDVARRVGRRVRRGEDEGAAGDPVARPPGAVSPETGEIRPHPRDAPLLIGETRHLADEEGVAHAVGHARNLDDALGHEHAVAAAIAAGVTILHGDA